MEFHLSTDQAALVNPADGREVVFCYFCNQGEVVPQPSGVLIHSKPNKWALIHGGTRRNPKRFFICEKCAGIVVRRNDRN